MATDDTATLSAGNSSTGTTTSSPKMRTDLMEETPPAATGNAGTPVQ